MLFLRLVVIASLAIMLPACAGNVFEGLRSAGHWLIPQQNDRPEDVGTTRNDAASHAAYLAERERLLKEKPARTRENQVFDDRARIQRHVLQLAPVGSDIADAKINLELNGFICGWVAENKQGMRCDLANRAAGTPPHWRVLINNRKNQVAGVSISPVTQ